MPFFKRVWWVRFIDIDIALRKADIRWLVFQKANRLTRGEIESRENIPRAFAYHCLRNLERCVDRGGKWMDLLWPARYIKAGTSERRAEN